MARDTVDDEEIMSRDQLVGWFEKGVKPRDAWRIGTEHEKFPFHVKDLSPVAYDGEAGIRAILEALQARSGWDPITDRDAIIGLHDAVGGGAISLEPGGQFELSGAPLEDIHAAAVELDSHLDAVNAIASDMGIAFLGLGTSPLWSFDETPRMPKSRYAIMRAYMPKVGTRGLDMMYRTSTVQVNLDFATEADMAEKMRVSLALQPLATALFAASPFLDGAPTGALSTRSEIWLDTDRDRTGMLPFAFESGFGFERYADWALDVPMYFVKRGDTYHDVTGTTFRQFLAGALRSKLPDVVPEIGDWTNHLGTLFPEARLKRYIEQRGADAGPRDHLLALPAVWTGLLYDDGVLDQALQLTRYWSADDLRYVRREVSTKGLRARIGKRTLNEIGRDALSLAHEGLRRRARLDATGRDERQYLHYLDDIVASGQSLADRLLAAHQTGGARAIRNLFETYRI